MFHSKHGPISTVSERDGDFSRKSQIFSHPRVFCALLKEFPWSWVSALGVKNYNDGATGPRKKFDDIFCNLDKMHERDRQTDRQTGGRTVDGRRTPGHSKDSAYA